jgi:hypothetical protein
MPSGPITITFCYSVIQKVGADGIDMNDMNSVILRKMKVYTEHTCSEKLEV